MDPESSSPQGLRIVVLYNQDFLRERDEAASALSSASRADVAKTAQQVARALAARGHFAQAFGVDAEELGDWISRLRDDPPDVVFNLCESLRNDDRHERVIPALLEALCIPYTGTEPFFLELALHKDRTHRWLQEAGIPTPAWMVVGEHSDPRMALAWKEETKQLFPLIVKPSRENASVGIDQGSVVYDDVALIDRIGYVQKTFQQPVLVEQYIAGREVNVAYLSSYNDEILPLHEIDFSQLSTQHAHIVGYDGKWDVNSAEYVQTLPRLAQGFSLLLEARIKQVAQQVFSAMKVRDYGRCDLRVSSAGDVFVIDVNPNCDLSQDAGYAKAAWAGGLSYEVLVEKIALLGAQRGDHARIRSGESINSHSRSHAQGQGTAIPVAREIAPILGG